VYNRLRVDKEPKRTGSCRVFSRKGSDLVVQFEAIEAKHLRVSVNTFFDHLKVCVKTIDRFGPPSGTLKDQEKYLGEETLDHEDD